MSVVTVVHHLCRLDPWQPDRPASPLVVVCFHSENLIILEGVVVLLRHLRNEDVNCLVGLRLDVFGGLVVDRKMIALFLTRRFFSRGVNVPPGDTLSAKAPSDSSVAYRM